MDPQLILHAIYALLYGDMVMQMLYRVRPYEREKGSADRLYDSYMSRAKVQLPRSSPGSSISSAKIPSRAFDTSAAGRQIGANLVSASLVRSS
jgi:hypothetical protein